MRDTLRKLGAELEIRSDFLAPCRSLRLSRDLLKRRVQFNTIEVSGIMLEKVCLPGFLRINRSHPILASPLRTPDEDLRLVLFRCLCKYTFRVFMINR